SSATAQAPSPLEGRWKVNLQKSTYSPGPPPQSQTLSWERIPGGLRFTVDSINAQGQSTHNVTVEKDDGSEAPVEGAATPTVRGMRRVDANTYEDHDKVNGKPTVTRKTVISRDGKSITVTMKGTNAQGQTVNNIVVDDRQ